MTDLPMAECPVCGHSRITFTLSGVRRIRSHTPGDVSNPYSPAREGEDCAGSWQPVNDEAP